MSDSVLRASERRYVDFHTHILQGVDDGSCSVEQSMHMIRTLAEDNVGFVVLTPHFYPQVDNPQSFIKRRNHAFDALCEAYAMEDDISDIKLIVGAEIEYFDGLVCMADYPELKLGDSNCILVEMPAQVWTTRMVDDLLELNGRPCCQVVIAHVERYLFAQRHDVINELMENGILMQSNADFFIGKRTSRKALKFFKKGFIHLLGSDCHNLVDRTPNIGAALNIIKKRLGEDAIEFMMDDARSLLGF